MKIEVLFFGGCPNHEPTVEIVHEIVRDLEVNIQVNEVEVCTAEGASSMRFLGSPTVQIDGVDIEPSRREDTDYAMSCRMYGSSGVPSRELIEAALRGSSA